MPDIPRNLTAVRGRIAQACAAAGRPPESVRLVGVTKTWGSDAIRAAAAAGLTEFGENYLQEALSKLAARSPGQTWHFIGPVQSNKTREIATHFDWVHGVDRLKIAQRLAQQRPAGLPPLEVCVQVNISAQASKAGCGADAAPALCAAVAELPNLRLRGLMALPAPVADRADPREPYRRLRALLESIRARGLALDTLSAGMSDDLEDAIAEGSTMVRVGTAIFGSRD